MKLMNYLSSFFWQTFWNRMHMNIILMIKLICNQNIIQFDKNVFLFEKLNFTLLTTMADAFCQIHLVKQFLFDFMCFITFELIIQSIWTFFIFNEMLTTFSEVNEIHADLMKKSLFCLMSVNFASTSFAHLSLLILLDCRLIPFLVSSVFNNRRHSFLRWSIFLRWSFFLRWSIHHWIYFFVSFITDCLLIILMTNVVITFSFQFFNFIIFRFSKTNIKMRSFITFNYHLIKTNWFVFFIWIKVRIKIKSLGHPIGSISSITMAIFVISRTVWSTVTKYSEMYVWTLLNKMFNQSPFWKLWMSTKTIHIFLIVLHSIKYFDSSSSWFFVMYDIATALYFSNWLV